MLLSSCGLMLLSILSGFLLLSSIGHVNAEPKVISMDTKRMHSNTLHKRDSGAVSITDYFNILYYVNATVGTPGQNITFVIDTAASDVWMPGPELSRQVDFGSFNPKDSISYVAIEGSYEADYTMTVNSEGTVKGKFFNDTISLGNYKLVNFKMVAATEAPNGIEGSLGLDFGDEGNVTVLDAMVAADLIKSRTYSLWLNSKKSDAGAIIFGGYDNAKYYNDIVMLDSQSDEDFVVALTDLYIFPHDQNNRKFKREPEETSSEQASSTEEASASATDDVAQSFGLTGPLTAIIDSSSTFTSLPKDLVARLAKYVGATLAQDSRYYVLPCETNVDADLYFQLGGKDGPGIAVDMTELLISFPDDNGEPMTFPGTRTTACALGITPIDDDQNVILGQTFLRSAYVFFDVDLKKVGFANAKWDVTDSDIQELANGGSVKSASSVAGASITQSPSAARGAPGAGFTANATLDVGQPGSPVTSLEGGVKTTLSGDRPHGVCY